MGGKVDVGRNLWAKYVPRQSEILLLTFAEIVRESIFSDTSAAQECT